MEAIPSLTIAGWIASQEENISRLEKQLPELNRRNAKVHAATLASIAKLQTTDPADPVAFCKALLEAQKALAEQSRPAHNLKLASEELEILRQSQEGLTQELRRRDMAAKSTISGQ